MPPAQQAFALPMVSPVAGRQFDVCGVESSPRSTSTLLASIARNCGAKPWSEDTSFDELFGISESTSASVLSASTYALRMNARRCGTRPSGVPFTCTSSKAGFGAPFGSVCVTSPRNWCWNSSVVGTPTIARSGLYFSRMYLMSGWCPVDQ